MEIGSCPWRQLIIDSAAGLGLQVAPWQAHLFAQHAHELLHWNRKMRLTAITAPQAVAINHFVDCIIPANLIAPCAKLLDIGSGGGFPGIPLKVIRPKLAVTLIDGTRKKVSFMQHVIRKLGLEHIQAFQRRAEQMGVGVPFAGPYDVVISRALAPLSKLLRWSLPLIGPQGHILALKGRDVQLELAALTGQDWDKAGPAGVCRSELAISVREYTLPLTGDRRAIVKITPLSA